MTLLAAKLHLHDVHDTEALVRRALDDELRTRRIRLNHADHDDCLSYLIATAWELSERYDPKRSRPHQNGHSNFASWCYRITRLRVTSWIRETKGDNRSGTRPEFISLELQSEIEERLDLNPHRHRRDFPLERAFRHGARDAEDDRSPDLARALSA